MVKTGYRKFCADRMLFGKRNAHVTIWFFVDNIIVIDHDVLELEILKKRLGLEFEIKDHDEFR